MQFRAGQQEQVSPGEQLGEGRAQHCNVPHEGMGRPEPELTAMVLMSYFPDFQRASEHPSCLPSAQVSSQQELAAQELQKGHRITSASRTQDSLTIPLNHLYLQTQGSLNSKPQSMLTSRQPSYTCHFPNSVHFKLGVMNL